MYPCMRITREAERVAVPGSLEHRTETGARAGQAVAPDAEPAQVTHVLAVCDLSRGGRAALHWAADAARSSDAPLTLVALARRERSDVGCVRCRQGAALWNQHLDEITSERLAQAQALIGDGVRVGFEVAEEPAVSGVAQAAARVGADLIVLPRHGLDWRRGTSAAARLRQLGDWSVTVVP